MSLSNNFPTVFPALNLDFVNNPSLDPRITFTRATTATYFDSSGVLRTAAADTARFDNNPSTLAPLGLLIEEQRTNSLKYSEQFDNAVWLTSSVSITQNSAVAPNQTQTADTMTGTGSGTSYIYQGVTLTTATAYSFSVFVKDSAIGSNKINLRDFTDAGVATFDIVGQTAPVTSGIASNAVMKNVGNGWYQISATFTTTIATGNHNLGIVFNTGNTTSSVYLWGAQVEAGAFATSYIPTTTTALTRNADVATMTGTNFSSWYNATAGTLYAQAVPNSPTTNPTNQVLVSVDDGTPNNRMQLGRPSSSGAYSWFISVAGVTGYNSFAGTFAANATSSEALAYAAADQKAAYAGALDVGSGTGTIPTVNQMHIGTRADLVLPWNGTIKRISYYPTRLTNAQLQALTL